MELAHQVRRFRQERGLSQDELADAVFVTRQTVSNWENDKTYPDVQSLVLLSRLFDVSIDELIQGDVVTMRRTMAEDARKMRWLAVAMVVTLGLAIAFFIGLAAVWREPCGVGDLTKGEAAGLAAFTPLYVLSLAAALAIERIKRCHDLVTYQEIMAFADGSLGDGERAHSGFARSHPVAATIVKFVFAAAVGAVLGLLIYKLIAF